MQAGQCQQKTLVALTGLPFHEDVDSVLVARESLSHLRDQGRRNSGFIRWSIWRFYVAVCACLEGITIVC